MLTSATLSGQNSVNNVSRETEENTTNPQCQYTAKKSSTWVSDCVTFKEKIGCLVISTVIHEIKVRLHILRQGRQWRGIAPPPIFCQNRRCCITTCPPPPLCVEMGFTWTFHRNQDATVKLKSELISIKF